MCGFRYLSLVESWYSMSELEPLAVAWAAKKCSFLILCRNDVVVYSDHKPLLPPFFVRATQRAGLTLVDFCPMLGAQDQWDRSGIFPEPLVHPTASWSDVPVGGERGPWSPQQSHQPLIIILFWRSQKIILLGECN